jgi:hypothetical protein
LASSSQSDETSVFTRSSGGGFYIVIGAKAGASGTLTATNFSTSSLPIEIISDRVLGTNEAIPCAKTATPNDYGCFFRVDTGPMTVNKNGVYALLGPGTRRQYIFYVPYNFFPGGQTTLRMRVRDVAANYSLPATLVIEVSSATSIKQSAAMANIINALNGILIKLNEVINLLRK